MNLPVVLSQRGRDQRGSIAGSVVQGGRAGAEPLADPPHPGSRNREAGSHQLDWESLYPEAQVVFEERLPALNPGILPQ